MTPDTDGDDGPAAEYVFRVRLRVEPQDSAVRLDPATLETTLYRRAATPGDDGWLFFRDNLWRGEVNDEAHLRESAEETLGVPVERIEFRELRCSPDYFDALKAEIAADLALFRADDATSVVNKYLGSSVHVVE